MLASLNKTLKTGGFGFMGYGVGRDMGVNILSKCQVPNSYGYTGSVK